MHAIFPDSTVLVNLAHVQRISLLTELFPRLGWCASVAVECKRSEAHDLPDLANAPKVLGKPYHPDPAEYIDLRKIRDEMAKPGDNPNAHLGEAETISIILRRRLPAVFFTDDTGATLKAKSENITTATTWKIFQIAFRKGVLTCDDVWHDCNVLKRARRGWPPCGPSKADVCSWLAK